MAAAKKPGSQFNRPLNDRIEPGSVSRSDFASLPKSTVTISFRVPAAERERIRRAVQKKYGERLSKGVKAAIYEWMNSEGY